MVRNPPDGQPRISPYLLYEDLEVALEWLSTAFGLRERFRIPGPDGRPSHAEMVLADGVVMMGHPGPVDGVDAHFERATAAGAKVIAELEDKFYGDRNYMAADLEGHHWCFSEHVRDVAPEDMHP